MRSQTKDFITKFLKEHPMENPKVLDVGSLDVNGNLSGFFPDYLSIDMREGPNVQQVLNAHDISSLGEFDLVFCFDMLEHDDKFWLTLEQIKKHLSVEGYLLIGVPSLNCPIHDHPNDYYRFTEPAVKVMFEGMEDVYIEAQKDSPDHGNFDEIYGWGKK